MTLVLVVWYSLFMNDLDFTLRKFTIEKLEALKAITDSLNPVISTTTISGCLSKIGPELGGILSSLSRTKINGEPLLLSVGRSSTDGILWRLNDKAAPIIEIKSTVDLILEQNKEYRMALKNQE